MKVIDQHWTWINKPENALEVIETAGRVCWKSEDKIGEGSAENLINKLKSKGHTSVLEHIHPCIKIITDRGNCYDDITEVLTNNGWKLFKDIDNEDLFLTLNFYTGQTEYQEKTNYFEEYYEGEMIGGMSSMVDFLVTPNHRMYYYHYDSRKNKNWKIDFAADIFGKRVKFERGLPSEWKGYNFEINYPNQEKLDFARFLGLFITDGSKYKGEDSGGTVWIHQFKKENHDYIRAVLNNLNMNYKEKENGFKICNTSLYNFLDYNFSQVRHENGYVPNWIKNASKEYISSFIEGVIIGDGNIHKSNNHKVIYTTNKKLADDYQECLLKTGFSSTIREDDRIGKIRWNNKIGNYMKNNKKCYIVSITERTNKHLFNKRNWYKVNYNGNIYCVTVPNGIIYIRRNGKAMWSCNSHELVRHRIANYSQESTRYANYSKEKFGNEITVIRPVWYSQKLIDWIKKGKPTINIDEEFGMSSANRASSWYDACKKAENSYLMIIENGGSPQEARSVLPNSLKTEIVITANMREWRHIFDLRCSKAAHPQIRDIMLNILESFYNEWNILFDDIAEKYLKE